MCLENFPVVIWTVLVSSLTPHIYISCIVRHYVSSKGNNAARFGMTEGKKISLFKCNHGVTAILLAQWQELVFIRCIQVNKPDIINLSVEQRCSTLKFKLPLNGLLKYMSKSIHKWFLCCCFFTNFVCFRYLFYRHKSFQTSFKIYKCQNRHFGYLRNA